MYGPMHENGYQRIKVIKSPGIVIVSKDVKRGSERTVKILGRQPGRSEKKRKM